MPAEVPNWDLSPLAFYRNQKEDYINTNSTSRRNINYSYISTNERIDGTYSNKTITLPAIGSVRRKSIYKTLNDNKSSISIIDESNTA